MISKKAFITLINYYKSWSSKIETIGKIMGPSIWESDIYNIPNTFFSTLLTQFFNEEGIEDIEWWLFEKAGYPTLQMWNEDHSIIPTETVEDLWEIVKSERI